MIPELLMRASYGLHRTTAGMLMEDHEVFSKVTGGRAVFTSAAVSGGAPGPPKPNKGGNRAGVPSLTRSCA